METAHCSVQQLPSGADDIRLDSCLRCSIAAGKKVVEAADLGADKRSKVFDEEFLFGMLSNYLRLVTSDGRFDSGTMVSLVQGCSQTADLESGKILHCCAFRRGFDLNPIFSTAIVDLYSKCGAIKQAPFVFNRMEGRNMITWTAMLVGLAQNGHAEEALKRFCQMREEGIAANW
ncbi:pentatricopeptide repeat-containing protein [Prunus yedoensis var. nudiflora]|uniref:Pentatricopeptide repeat-containing protein n=1 Tax=Prunus yedoensis var. nudiflora TaxID=2094558 RepID=A0A314Z1J8_PRUYE|nr:pentatricopeptide repeat-containing protein [Prunus yedoensis var. nudiflora]